MALTRKFLEALGIEQAKIDEIISAHTEVTNSLKEERDKLKEKAEKFDETKTELDKTKADLDKLGKDGYKAKYESLNSEFEKYKADVVAKSEKSKKEVAYRQLLKDIGVNEKSIEAIVKVKDFSAVKLDDKGQIEGLDSLKEEEKKNWEGFIVTTDKDGNKPNTPPDKDKDNVDFASMSMEDYIKGRENGTIK